MSKIVFEVLIDTGFSDICTNPDLAPIDNKSVLSFLNDFEEGKWRNERFLEYVCGTGGRVLSLRVWRCNPVSRIIGVSNNQ